MAHLAHDLVQTLMARLGADFENIRREILKIDDGEFRAAIMSI